MSNLNGCNKLTKTLTSFVVPCCPNAHLYFKFLLIAAHRWNSDQALVDLWFPQFFHLQTSHSDWVQFYYRNLKVVRRLEHVSLVLSRQGEHIPGSVSVSVSVCEPLCIFTYTHPQLCQNIKSACVWEVGQWLTSAFPFPAESSCSGGVIVAPGCLVRDRGSHALVVNL